MFSGLAARFTGTHTFASRAHPCLTLCESVVPRIPHGVFLSASRPYPDVRVPQILAETGTGSMIMDNLHRFLENDALRLKHICPRARSRRVMIVVYGIDEKLTALKARLSKVIQGCMLSVLGISEGKRAQHVMPMVKENFYYPEGRSDAYTVIEINMMQGARRVRKKR